MEGSDPFEDAIVRRLCINFCPAVSARFYVEVRWHPLPAGLLVSSTTSHISGFIRLTCCKSVTDFMVIAPMKLVSASEMVDSFSGVHVYLGNCVEDSPEGL